MPVSVGCDQTVPGVASSITGRFRLAPLLEEFDGVGEGAESLEAAEEDLRKDILAAGEIEVLQAVVREGVEGGLLSQQEGSAVI